MADQDNILRHAVTAPSFDRTKLHRERLVDSIHANIPRKLIAIAAPPGYGKTTLLADFTASTELPVCWMRLTEADKDVMRFTTLFGASLQRRFRRLRGKPSLEGMARASPEALAMTFVEVIDSHIDKTFVIILDDVQLINPSKPVLAFLDKFLDSQPEQVTLIAAGQEVLEVSVAKLMADGDLAGFGPHDLALTKEELVTLVDSQLGISLAEQEADRVLEETRGWVTGILLSGMLAGNTLGPVANGPRPMVYEYLASVVLNRQPDELRRFMLDSSVLPIMTAETCDTVLRRDDSARLLTRILRTGLFVTATDESPRTYEYHPQFRSFLLDVLEAADSRRLKSLRVRAADHLTQIGSPEHAVDLFIEGGAYRRAAQLAEKRAKTMLHAGRLQTLEEWSKRLDERGVAAPRVFLYLAQGYVDRGDLDAGERSLARARAMMVKTTPISVRAKAEVVHGMLALPRGEYQEVFKAADRIDKLLSRRGDRLNVAASLRLRALANASGRRDFAAAEKLATGAVKLLKKGDEPYLYAAALVDLSNVQAALGMSIEANNTSRKALELFQEMGAPLPLAIAYNNLAIDAHFRGDYEEALSLFNEGLKYSRQAASLTREAHIYFGQADVFNDLGLAYQAAELYGMGLRIATQLDDIPRIRYGCVQTSVLHRRHGGIGLAHEWLKRALTLETRGKSTVAERIQLTALETEVTPEHARSIFMGLLSQNENALDAVDRTLILYFLAKACKVAGAEEKALSTFEEALTWAGSRGTEQLLAAEMHYDDEMRAFVSRKLSGNLAVSVVLHRIETMRAVAQQYREPAEAEQSTPTLAFFALGRAKIVSEALTVSDLKPLVREILFYLVDRGRVGRDQLLETFWPKYSAGRQVSNLHTAVYSVRRALGKDAVIFDGSVYMLSRELNVEYDVTRFERAAGVAEGLPMGDPRRLFALTEAINSYPGSFLPEMDSEWVLERRRALELRYLDLLAAHSEEALVRNQPLRAVHTLHQALKIDPFRDDTNLRLLEALGRLGRRSEVVAHYRQYVRLMADELGLDPSQAVRELYSRLIG